jgi:ketosteroid isomerase-like protein
MSAQTPEQCDELFGKYVNARELDNLAALYEEHASLMNEDGTAIRGAVAIRNALQGFLDALPEATITMKVLRVAKAGDDLAGAIQRLEPSRKRCRWRRGIDES